MFGGFGGEIKLFWVGNRNFHGLQLQPNTRFMPTFCCVTLIFPKDAQFFLNGTIVWLQIRGFITLEDPGWGFILFGGWSTFGGG